MMATAKDVLIKIEVDKDRSIVSLSFWEDTAMKYLINISPDEADRLAQFILKNVTPKPVKDSMSIAKEETGR